MNNKSFLNTIFESFGTKFMDRNSAYLISKYGRKVSESEMFKEFLKETKSLVKQKTANGEYSLVAEIPEEIVKYIDAIEEFYVNKLDYGMAVINGETLSQSFSKGNYNSKTTYMFLSWGQTDENANKIPEETLNKIINSSIK